MGEVAALATAFDSEFAKTLSALPALHLCSPDEHDAYLNHHRFAIRLSETVAYYASKLPPFASAQRILTFADRLVQRGEYKLAQASCYEHVRSLNLHLNAAQRLDVESRLSYHVQACYGVATCEAALVLQRDEHIKQPDTLQELVDCMAALKDALALVLPAEGLYWLSLNGMVHIYSLVKRLLVAGFVTQMLPFLVFCVKALESHVVFSSAKHLPWRTQLYVALCNSYIDLGEYDIAKRILSEGTAKINAVIKLQKLDPVPVKPAVQAAFRTAKAMLSALQLRLEALSAPASASAEDSARGAAATPAKGAAAIPPKGAKSPTKGAKGAPAGVAAGSDVVEQIPMPASLEVFQPLLEEVSLTPLARLTAILEALQVPSRRVVRHEPAPSILKDLFTLAVIEAMPKVSAIGAALKKRRDELQQWENRNQQEPNQEGKAEGDVAPAEGDPAPAPTAEGGDGATKQDAMPIEPPAVEDVPEAHQLPLILHKAMLCTAYNFEQLPQFEELLEAAQLRLKMGPSMPGTAVGRADDPHFRSFSAATTILAGVDKLERQPGPESIVTVAGMLQECHPDAARTIPDMLADAALMLYMSARPLLDGVYCSKDKEADLVTDVLRCLHACWESTDFDDAVLRIGSSVKLALLLENRDELYEARQVLLTTKLVVEKMRCDAALAKRHADDEHLWWISASRNQPSDSTAALLSGMGDTEQELACLHADVLAALYRTELRIGMKEMHNKAKSKQTRLIEEVAEREKKSNIFGVQTMRDKRMAEKKIDSAVITSSNPPLKERELLAAVGKNPYERALLLMQMAPFQPEAHQQSGMMQEAADLLTKAQAAEDVLFAGAQPAGGHRLAAPLQPKILQRNPNSVMITHFPLLLKATRKAAKYAVYAKSYGAGVAVSLNKTACEYPGTGVMTDLDVAVTVDGLRLNDTYVFAVAAYDEDGQIIGGLGTSTKEVLAALPLPLYMCWSHLVINACKMGLWALAKRGASLLFPHFIDTSVDRPLWEANPMDAQRINRLHLEAAAKPLLRTFVQAVYIYTGAVADQEALAEKGFSPSAITSVGKEYRTAYIEEQMARLKNTKRLLIAIEVSVLLHDEMLVQEGSVRTYHLIGPLLALKRKSYLLHKALSCIHVALQNVQNLVQDSIVGQEHNRATAAQVGSTMVYHLVDMSTLAGELPAAAYFGKLELELLRAYDPRFDVPGRTPLKELREEASACQDALLLQPQVNEYGALVLGERMGSEKDIVARTLPILSGPTPIDAWEKVLGFEDVVPHPRWVELVVRSIEASARKGHLDSIKAIAAQVTWHVRQALKPPPLDFEPWSLQAAVEALPGGAPPVTPDPAAESTVEDPEEVAAEAAAAAERVRLAAVLLLQKRLPVLMLRKKAIGASKQKVKQWAPWLARLNTVLGLVVAAEARSYQKAKREFAEAQVLKMRTVFSEADSPPPSPVGKSGSPKVGAKKPGSPKGKPGSAAKKAPGSPKAGAKGKPVTPDPAATEAEPLPVSDAPVMALLHFARAAQLAHRGAAWGELLNALRHLWNCTRALLNADASSAVPTPPLMWELGPMPPPREAPESMIAAGNGGVAGGKDVKGGKGAKGGKEAAKKPGSPAKGKKAAAVVADVVPDSSLPQVWLAKGSAPNTARALRSAVEALLAMVTDMRSGTAIMHNGVIPLGGELPSALGLAGDTGFPRPRAKAAEPYEPSEFSYGSDLQAELWFQNGALDMEWCQRLMQMVLQVLCKMERWHSVLSTGQNWIQLSEGAFNERTLPYLLQAGTASSSDVSRLTASMEVVIRDKNQALDQLDKMRTLVRDRIGEPSMLQMGTGTKLKKKLHIKKPVRPGSSDTITNKFISKEESMADTASIATATTLRSKNSLPDFAYLPAEYVKVVEVLKKRCEKTAMILAINEMGDVHAHFGNWAGATTAWNDALDALIGPYQVLKHWRKALDTLSQKEILQSYGVHGLLLAGVLLGKLSRYSYYDAMDIKLQAARMSATLLLSIFCNSLAHPQRRSAFATYVPRELWDSAAVFADSYRCNMTDLLSCLETTVTLLLDHSLALDALPVIALWEHVTYLITRGLPATVFCRIKRVEALLQLGMMSDACAVLTGLMAGQKLPDAVMDTDLVVKNEDGTVLQVPQVPPFNDRRWPGDPVNKDVVTHISNFPIPLAVEKLYGSWLVAHINIARCHTLMCLGGLPNLWKLTDPATGLKVSADSPLPEPVESSLLDQAGQRLAHALAMARGEPPPEAEPATPAGKGAAPAKGAAAAMKPGSPKKAAAVSPPSSPPPQDHRDVDDQAQRGEVHVRALLLQSKLEMLKWQPMKALVSAEAAIRFMASNAERLNSVMQDNDESERYAISQLLWMKARLQSARCTAALRHTTQCYKLVELALSEGAAASDALFSAELLQLQGNMQEIEGQAAMAIGTYRDVAARYQALSIEDLRIASAFVDLSLLHDRLGLRQDSALLGDAAEKYLEAWTSQLGLREAKEHAEMVNIYAAGTFLYARILKHSAKCHLLRCDMATSQSKLELALLLLRAHCRSLPPQLARTALALGRVMRIRALAGSSLGAPKHQAPPPLRSSSAASSSDSGTKTTAEALSAAQSLLTQALTVACLDAGHLRAVMREALLEMAALFCGTMSAAKAAACLRSALLAAARNNVLMQSGHTLVPIAMAQVPEWALVFVKGQEECFNAVSGKPTDAPLSDADAGRALLCLFVALSRSAEALPTAYCEQAEAQRVLLHTSMQAACAKYNTEACFPEVPLPPNAPTEPVAGGTLVQWYPQVMCWQEPASWKSSTSALPGSAGEGMAPPSDLDILALPPASNYASMLYVVTPTEASASGGGGCVCGEMVFEVDTVRNLQRLVKELRYRIESPKAPTDLFGHAAPGEAELTGLRRSVERFLARRRQSRKASMNTHDDDDDDDDYDSRTDDGSSTNEGAGGMAAIPPGATMATDLKLLTRLEALLSVENGVEVVDSMFADWLGVALPKS